MQRRMKRPPRSQQLVAARRSSFHMARLHKSVVIPFLTSRHKAIYAGRQHKPHSCKKPDKMLPEQDQYAKGRLLPSKRWPFAS